MNIFSILQFLSLVILAYFFIISIFYFFTFLLSFKGLITHKIRSNFSTPREILNAKITPPISVLAPAYNEEKSIVTSVNSLLNLEYGQYEDIVINDGSRDNTLEVLIKEFDLAKTSRNTNPQIPTKKISDIYKSRKYDNLVVVDKENGGKADSLNAGINVSMYPLFCCIDADSILEKTSLLKIVHPFMEAYTSVVATGGIVRVANGCIYQNRPYPLVRTSDKLLVNIQVVEYFRAFLSGRMALTMMDCNMIISGAFGLFKKQPVIDIGGYKEAVVGEDMELVVRLHHEMRKKKQPCGIYFIPDTVCWTEVPESLKILSRQRNRWHRGLAESLTMHIGILMNPKYGTVGLIGMPYFFFVEFMSPIVELAGYIIFVTSFYLKAIDILTFSAFFILAVAFGLVHSLLALLMEEVTYHRYPKIKDLLKLMASAVVEHFGYRQYMAIVRAKGIFDWLIGNKSWGLMERIGIK